ncbi:Ribose import permease protein RbsC [subsurface metagenome]
MAEIVERPKPLTAREMAGRVIRHENAVLIVVLAALVGGLGVITGGLTTSRANMMNVLLQSSVRGVAAVGQAFVILTAGIDLSVGGMGLVASVIGASMMTASPEWSLLGYPVSMYLAIPVMLLVGAGFGVFNGSLVSRIGMPALIVTLGMWQICTGIAFGVSGGFSIAELPAALVFWGEGRVAGVPVPVIVFVAVGVVAYFVLYHTTFGRSIYAVGGNPVVAWLSGIRVKNIRLMVFIIAGFLAGLAGVLWTARTMSAQMRSLMGLELDTIAAVCIGGISLMGGRGTLIGAIIGVMIIGVVNNGMSILGAGPFMQGIVRGAIIIAAVAVDYIRKR